MDKKEIETFCPASREEWRIWLQENHGLKQSVWLLCYKKETLIPSISWSDAVDEALCFGWIDSTRKSLEEGKFIQFFSKRKSNSVWSKINKAKVQQLIDSRLMAQAGHDTIERAKQNGTWTILDEVEELIIPKDLEIAFRAQTGSKKFFLSLSKSNQKAILQWLVLAKRVETRQTRISEIATLAAQKLKPKQFS